MTIIPKKITFYRIAAEIDDISDTADHPLWFQLQREQTPAAPGRAAAENNHIGRAVISIPEEVKPLQFQQAQKNRQLGHGPPCQITGTQN